MIACAVLALGIDVTAQASAPALAAQLAPVIGDAVCAVVVNGTVVVGVPHMVGAVSTCAPGDR